VLPNKEENGKTYLGKDTRREEDYFGGLPQAFTAMLLSPLHQLLMTYDIN